MLAGSAVLFAVVVALLLYGLLRRHGSVPDGPEDDWIGDLDRCDRGVDRPARRARCAVRRHGGGASGDLARRQNATDNRRLGAPVVLVGRLSRRRVCVPRTRSTFPSGVSVLVRVASPDVDPQPLGAGAEPEDRRHPRAGQRGRLACRTGPASSGGSAPSSAASSTPGWRCTWSRSHRAQFDGVVAQTQARPAPQPSTAFLERGQQIFLGSACEYCHTIAGTNAIGHDRARSDAHREPPLDRRGDAPEQRRATSPAGSSIRSTSSRTTRCRRPRSPAPSFSHCWPTSRACVDGRGAAAAARALLGRARGLRLPR